MSLSVLHYHDCAVADPDIQIEGEGGLVVQTLR